MAFTPAIAIDLSTHASRARPAITSTIQLPSGQSAIDSVSVAFPSAFGFNERFHPPRCRASDEQNRTCPDGSRIGTISAESQYGPATGSVYITQDFRLVAFATAAGGAVAIKATGTISITPDDGFAVTFTGLPNLAISSVRLAFDDGDLALLKTPATCGTFTLPVVFTSYAGERAEAAPSVDVTGCSPALAITGVTVTPSQPQAGRAATVRWKVAPAGSSTQVVLRRGARTVSRRVTKATHVRFGSLQPGRYRVRLRALASGRRSPVRTAAFSVARR
jgi:hypothetical protein